MNVHYKGVFTYTFAKNKGLHMRTFFLTESGLNVLFAAGEGASVPAVDIIAYTGKDVQLGGFYWPVVMDLSSFNVAKSVPLLWNHDPDTVVGHAESVEVLSTKVKAKGKLSGVNERVDEIKASSANGMPWQVSVGVTSKRVEFIDSQSEVKVNGKTFAGPLYVARDNTLRELSILSLGADSDTSAKLAASLYQGGVCMFEEWVTKTFRLDPATLTDEQKTAFRAQYDAQNTGTNPGATVPPVVHTTPVVPNGTNVAAGASGGQSGTVSVADYHQQIVSSLQALNANIAKINTPPATPPERQNVPAIITSYGNMGDNKETAFAVLACSLAMTCKHQRIDARFPAQVIERASKIFRAGISLQQTFHLAAKINGFTGERDFRDNDNFRDILRAAFSTINIPTILSDTATVSLMEGYNSIDNTWREIATTKSAQDFRTITNARMVGGFTFLDVAPHGRIKHGTLSEDVYTNRVRTKGRMVQIGREDFINDSLDAFSSLPRELGRGGATGLARGVWEVFMDNAAFFVAGNENVSAGALSVTGLNNALTVFRKLKGVDGEYLNFPPVKLIVPPELEGTANQLYTSANLVGGNTAAPGNNPHVNKYRPVVSPYLSDTDITGNSATAYYLLTNPENAAAVVVHFLNGRDTPFVEMGDPDFSQLGVAWRAYFDWGASLMEPTAGVRSTGA